MRFVYHETTSGDWLLQVEPAIFYLGVIGPEAEPKWHKTFSRETQQFPVRIVTECPAIRRMTNWIGENVETEWSFRAELISAMLPVAYNVEFNFADENEAMMMRLAFAV